MKHTITIPTKEQLQKYENLKNYLKSFNSVAIAFSGGVDSVLLLYAAKESLRENVLAVTASACYFPDRELNEAIAYCKKENIRQCIFELDGLAIDGFADNPKNRCYLCKHKLFEKIQKIAEENDIAVIAEGSNLDDSKDYRPGVKAIEELGIKSPLKDCDLNKEDIRTLSKYFDISVWNKQSFACLSSRFVYGETITKEKLTMVDKAEQLLLDMGFHQVRVRIHNNIARIEIMPEEFGLIMKEENRIDIYQKIKSYGFSYVTLDLQGYRSGSMNETLNSYS